MKGGAKLRTWLKETREQSGLTQKELAHRIGVSRPAYTMIENGSRNPSVGIAKRIGLALEIDWTYFFASECNETTPTKISN